MRTIKDIDAEIKALKEERDFISKKMQEEAEKHCFFVVMKHQSHGFEMMSPTSSKPCKVCMTKKEAEDFIASQKHDPMDCINYTIETVKIKG